MGTISIKQIILFGETNATADLTGVSGSNVLLEKQAGNLDLIVSDAIHLQGRVEGALKLVGGGTITLAGMVVCQNLNRDAFTGTIITNGFWVDYSGAIFWVYSKHSNLFDVLHVLAGGIR